jgi:hypothetical protein
MAIAQSFRILLTPLTYISVGHSDSGFSDTGGYSAWLPLAPGYSGGMPRR